MKTNMDFSEQLQHYSLYIYHAQRFVDKFYKKLNCLTPVHYCACLKHVMYVS